MLTIHQTVIRTDNFSIIVPQETGCVFRAIRTKTWQVCAWSWKNMMGAMYCRACFLLHRAPITITRSLRLPRLNHSNAAAYEYVPYTRLASPAHFYIRKIVSCFRYNPLRWSWGCLPTSFEDLLLKTLTPGSSLPRRSCSRL